MRGRERVKEEGLRSNDLKIIIETGRRFVRVVEVTPTLFIVSLPLLWGLLRLFLEGGFGDCLTLLDMFKCEVGLLDLLRRGRRELPED